MNNYNLISAILSEPWAISELSLDMLSPLVANLFDSRMAFEKGESIMPEIRSFGGSSSSGSVGKSYNVSVITIKGAMTKDDQFCGPAGMATMTNWIKQADQDPGVDSIILKLDTPGGTVVGTQELADAIKATTKPIIAFVDDMCCSGGYWLASQCDEIIANNRHAQIGSIGVMMSFMDAQPYYESLGIKFHTIRAEQSSEKNTMYDELRAGNYDAYKKDVLNPLAEKFIDLIKDSRPAVEDSQLKGAVYFAHAVEGSLIDSIGNFDYALQRAAALCEEHTTGNGSGANATENTEKPNSNLDMKKITILGTEYEVNAEGNIIMSEAQAEAVVDALVESDTRQETITAHEATIGAHEATIAELQKKPGATTAIAVQRVDAVETAEEPSAFETVSKLFESLK